MTIHFNVPGKKRKELAQEIGRWLGEDTHYCGAPSFAYEIDRFTLDKDGNLAFSDLIDSKVVERMLEHLYDEGFETDLSEEEAETTTEAPTETVVGADTGLCVSMPKTMVDEHTLANLEAIIAAKGNLIRKALGSTDLPIEVTDTKVSFPWFKGELTPEAVKAFDAFICKLCDMARTQKRITAKEKQVDNDKYAFRCFLLRLGFIGDEYKAERKILLRNLSGSSAFKSVKTEVDA